jgi:acetylglutamate kinase
MAGGLGRGNETKNECSCRDLYSDAVNASPVSAGDLELDGLAPQTRARLLIEALPYIQRFHGKIVVVKYGGNVLTGAAAGDEAHALRLFAQDVVLLHAVGMKPVVVHGGGPQIGELLSRLDIQSEFRNGLRVTDAATLDVARMVLIGKVNPDVVSAINLYGPLAVGLSGADSSLLQVTPIPELGYVGEVAQVNTDIVHRLLDAGRIPVIATIGVDEAGQAFNINADTAAGALAAALQAEKLVYLTNIEGLRRDVADPSSLISTIDVEELAAMQSSGALEGGMIPKTQSCVHAVRSGVAKAHILDGRAPHALLLEFFTDAGIGTEITRTPMFARSQP